MENTKKDTSKDTNYVDKVDGLVDQLMVFGSSLVYLAKDGAEEIIKELEKQNLLNSEEGQKAAKEIREKFTKRKDSLHKSVKSSVQSVIDELGIATKDDIDSLRK